MMNKTTKNTRAKEHESMRVVMAYVLVAGACLWLATGCESVRFVPGEAAKQNAWLHNRTALVAAETAEDEYASDKLQALTQLSELQSRAFSSYFGLPKEFPKAETAEDILSQASWQLAKTAVSESAQRPDPWRLADSMFELAIGVSALLGGVYGTRAVRFLKQARAKSQALKEIITGNELFKQQHADTAAAFKDAHKDQSSATRQLVAEMKES
jgi:hypothetical protein